MSRGVDDSIFVALVLWLIARTKEGGISVPKVPGLPKPIVPSPPPWWPSDVPQPPGWPAGAPWPPFDDSGTLTLPKDMKTKLRFV